MRSEISAALRRLVRERARGICEYCLISEDDTFLGCEVDHVISLKHGGGSSADNLALACVPCNRCKGSDLGSLAQRTEELTPFFNPRVDRWHEHFRLDASTIVPLTDRGEVTATIFGFNVVERLLERQALVAVGRFPSEAARLMLGLPSD